MVSRLQIAKSDIEAFFTEGKKVLRERDIQVALQDKREFWRLAQSVSLRKFIDFLLTKTRLRSVAFPFPQRHAEGFTWGRVPLMESLQQLLDGYFSHYTAMRVQGLTEQTPKVVYVTTEKSQTLWGEQEPKDPYPQEAIDAAFKRPARVSQNSCQVGALKVVHLTSAYHGAAGVTQREVNLGDEGVVLLNVTNLERTLIDIAVRPFYAGGVAEVMKAYALARDRNELSVNRMATMLRRMDFGYPYHQAIGFYLERAGYRPALLDIFRKFPQERDFYLTYEMGATEYVPQWRLHIPKGL